ncbi:hypothetical protein [Amycolatopsis sp. NPDC059657]|uniref:hypothetical protein n=1 Tax=Amycolatopsis sp. NPDC059657 TaxID=3346899 RepID=UPI00366CEFB3
MTTSPVTGDGDDRLVWRPGLDPARIQRRALRWLILKETFPALNILGGVAGVAAVVYGTVCDGSGFARLQLTLGSVLTVAVFLRSGLEYMRIRVELDDEVRARSLRNRPHGGNFFRIGDFAGLRTDVMAEVTSLVESLHFLHSEPAARWLDATLLSDAHIAAWQVLSIVDSVKPVRLAVKQARVDQELDGLVRSVDADLGALDAGVAWVAECLRQTVALVVVWTANVDALATAARLRAELETTVVPSIDPAVHAAESVPEAVFAYVTAARDLTGTGPFAWEHPATSHRRDDGAVSVLAAVLIPALVLVLALVVDGSGKMQAIIRADAIAAEAARAAETALDTRGTTIVVDPGTAAAAARTYLHSTGYPGEVTIENTRTVRVTVTVDQPATLGLLVDSYHATATATAVLGVGTSPAGAFP